MPKKVTRNMKEKYEDTEQTLLRKSNTKLVIRNGKPVLTLSYNQLNFIYTVAMAQLVICISCAVYFLISAIKTRTHLGYFINLVSPGDGDVLPSLQAVPVLFFLLANVAQFFITFKLFDPSKVRNKLNLFLFILIMFVLVLIVVTFIIIIVIMVHIHASHEDLGQGINKAMREYGTNSKIKSQIDRLQIEFACCGNKKYDEWYNITWYDKSLLKKGEGDTTNGNVPFSCCSMKSLYPCIHHDMETTGKAYLYTPENNLSLSATGCFDSIRDKKKQIGWGIIWHLILFLFMELFTVVLLRFIQTGHFEEFKFDGSSKFYTVWLLGCYSGRVMVSVDAPEPPPVPIELME